MGWKGAITLPLPPKLKGKMYLMTMLWIGRTSSQKYMQARRCVNKTHSTLSEMGPRLCNASWDGGTEHTKKASIYLEGKLYYCLWWSRAGFWMEIQANRMLKQLEFRTVLMCSQESKVGIGISAKARFLWPKVGLSESYVHTEMHHFSGTDWDFWNDPQRLVWFKL